LARNHFIAPQRRTPTIVTKKPERSFTKTEQEQEVRKGRQGGQGETSKFQLEAIIEQRDDIFAKMQKEKITKKK